MGIIGFLKTIFSTGQQQNTQEVDEPSITAVITMPVQSSPVKQPGPLDHVTEDFLNKNCESLDAFIISEEMNHFDLIKLAQLNDIILQVRSGWYHLLKQLVIELQQAGWDKRVNCIKEKYAELRFYARGFDDIINRYTRDSRYVCESCGAPGAIRHNSGWDYVACRKHYVETRSNLQLTENGFAVDGCSYLWKEVVDIAFKDGMDYFKQYHAVLVTFKETITVQHAGWQDNLLYLKRSDYGWGAFLAGVPGYFRSLDHAYINENFRQVSDCKTCGYTSVYNQHCECCEEKIWNEKEHDYYESEAAYYKSQQLGWYNDEGDVCEAMQPHYMQWAGYKKLVTAEEVKQYREEQKTWDAD